MIKKVLFGFACVVALVMAFVSIYIEPVPMNAAPQNPERKAVPVSTQPNVDALSMTELENFRIRLKNDKFYIYDGQNGYFEILSFTGDYEDLMNAMDSQPFKSKVYLDTVGRFVILNDRKPILITDTFPVFEYEEWKKSNENQ